MAFPSSLPFLLLLLLLPPFPSLSQGENVEDVGGVVHESSPPDEAPLESSSFVLASERTYRKDPLDGFRHYSGGWNISDNHYWASVALTAVPLFLIGVLWFLGFGLILLLMCCYYFCCQRREYSYSRAAYALSLVLLILFTIAAVIGCVVLYDGQGKFHNSTSEMVDFVVGKANFTVENLRNFSDNLAEAKQVRVGQALLGPDVQARIDDIETKLNRSANELDARTDDNSRKIQSVLESVRMQLIVIAAVMLLLAFLGFLLSVLGLQFAVYILVVIGWILVAGTFILSGVFLLLHNVAADTCVAMDEWVHHPHVHTALDNILPCVDVATANESLYRSKEVTSQLVNVVNQVISNLSNQNIPPNVPLLYYNQSGPLAPLLCNPFFPDLSVRKCGTGEVRLDNAPKVWSGYVCKASGPHGAQMCKSVGRFTPDMYSQLSAAVSAGFGLYHYGPFLVQLEDCSFVRETFHTIGREDCPDLSKYSRWVYVGLTMVSGAVMLSLVLWVIYARERRRRQYSNQFLVRPPLAPRAKLPEP